MANQIINVIVNSKGAVTVARELDKIGDSARQTTTYLNGLRAILAAALTFSGANQIIEVVDNFTVLQNRLRQVADESTNVGESWQRLMQIANASYSTIDGTVNLYFRVAQAYKAWGESAEEAYEFTDLFQKSAILSGSSMQTTAQAVYQFSQALNKGKLDGDEFRSVLEGLPYVATLIQKELGVTRAELYEMSKNGQITVDRITQAFIKAADTIRGDWGNITPTIGMALVVLKNNWTDFLGEVQTSTGIFSMFARLILAVANNLDLVALALSPVVVSIGFLAGRLGLGLVVLGLKDMFNALRVAIPLIWAFNAALLANPFILVGTLIAGAIAAIVYFRNEIGLTNEVLFSLWTSITTTFGALLSYFEPLYNAIAGVVSWFMEWNLAFVAIRAIVTLTWKDIVAMFTAATNAVMAFATYMWTTLAPLFESLSQMVSAYIELITQIGAIYADYLAPAVDAFLMAFKAQWTFIEPALKFTIKLLADIFTGWKNIAGWLQANFLPIVRDVFEGWIAILKTVVDWITSIINALKKALALMQAVGGGGGGGGGGGAHYGAQFKAGEGFANGGQFRVGGTGAGRDTTPVAFRAERGERVTVETKKQQRMNDNSGQVVVPSVNLTIKNVSSPDDALEALNTAKGHELIRNVMKTDRDAMRAALGVV